MREFKGKTAVVTGAASGIGFALAERCVQKDMRVILADIEEEALSHAVQMLSDQGGTVLPVVTDVSTPGDVETLAQQALDAYGAVHLLCNNAGVGAGGTIWESSLVEWEWVMGVNLWGVIHGIRVFVPIMLSQDTECHIVNTASISGVLSNPSASYQVTKHAVVALSEHLYHSLEQQETKIKTSVLCPGFVKTGILNSGRNMTPDMAHETGTATLFSPEDDEEAKWAEIAANWKVVEPAQIAACVFEAIKEERFYIFTHTEFNEYVRARMTDIVEARNPSWWKLLDDTK